MMHPGHSLPDNPFWNSLCTTHQSFAIGTELIKKFPEDILPFMGLESNNGELLEEIRPFFNPNEEAFIKADVKSIPGNWSVVNRISCIQMICDRLPSGLTECSENIEMLGPADLDELYRLVNLVQPGFLREKTHLLGDYYGIRKNGKLLATAGERLKMDGFIELSAVCTLPEHTGKGYAQQLMRKVCKGIFEKGQLPILHVLDSNVRAIKLYEMFNFRKRMDFPLVKLRINT
ncbi:MAG: GNAT family N-acetyltransferase [Chitinophagales bacterium]